MNARILSISCENHLRQEMQAIQPEHQGLKIMLPKGRFHLIKLEGITCASANILKQEMLSRGGEVVISSMVYRLKEGTSTDALLIGNMAQYSALLSKLRLQPLKNLLTLAGELEALLENYLKPRAGTTKIGKKLFSWGARTYVMGIINVTPDSFSGDGLVDNIEAAVLQGKRFASEGADILDVGGESTRPGSKPVFAEEEKARVIPVIRELRRETDLPISVDTSKASVAEAAIFEGASLVNDVWGLKKDPSLKKVVALSKIPVVLMHNRSLDENAKHSNIVGGHYHETHYDDLMSEIFRELRESIEIAISEGIPFENILIDPGVGFGKTPEQNLQLLHRLSELKSLGCPILLGTSRKSFIGKVLDLPPDQRLHGTAATVSLGISSGADIVRVHDVKEMAEVARMTDAIVRPRLND